MSVTYPGFVRLASFAFAVVLAAGAHQVASAKDGPVVVVELFTSQGCSSCPPADALLAELAGREDVIALSYHVDYWDYIGWEDPYGSPRHTKRQRRYAKALNLSYVYTPQIVIDGRIDVVGSRRQEVLESIEQARAEPKLVPVRIDADGSQIVVGPGPRPSGTAVVWIAVFDSHVETDVRKGENAGRHLVNAQVVREFETLGTWQGGEQAFSIDHEEMMEYDGCAVLVQEDATGRILGAASIEMH